MLEEILKTATTQVSSHTTAGRVNVINVIKARTEQIIEVDTVEVKDCLVIGGEISKSVFLCSSLSKPSNNKLAVTILNASDSDIEINSEQIASHINDLDDYAVEPFPEGNFEHNDRVPDRLRVLEEHLKLDHLNDEERQSILEICRDFHDLFHLPGDALTTTTATTHKIHMKSDNSVIFRKQYSRPRWEWDVINDHVKQLLADNRIVPSTSPYNSPVLVVPRKGLKIGES